MTIETECLGFHPDSPCEGAVEWHPTNPVRWRNNGTIVQFERCAKHYAEYLEITEARLEREQEALDSQYCRHGVFVGDAFGPDYMCGRCESE
jgi:hypothetical protein